MIVQIGETKFNVPDQVGTLMTQNWHALQQKTKQLEELTALTARVRHLQNKYFSSRSSLDLRASKAKEAELDVLLQKLAGTKPKEVVNPELFR